MKTALTIAGSDSSGGAGIQADLKTMTANGVFAMSAITALTAQNTTGVTDIFETTPKFLGEQLDAVFTDIYPDAVKIGMVSSAELIGVIAEKLKTYGAKHIVVDPVMVATSGSKLLRDDAVQALTSRLLPMAEVLTPNIPEAEMLSGMTITDAAGMEAAARAISEKYGCSVLCKGGHQINDAVAQWLRQVVLRQTHRQPQHARHRLHLVQCDCLQPCQGLQPRCLRGACQGVYFRLPVGHAGSRPRLRAHEPHVRSEGRVCR